MRSPDHLRLKRFLKPYDMSNNDVDEALKASARIFPEKLNASAWGQVHQFIMEFASEGK